MTAIAALGCAAVVPSQASAATTLTVEGQTAVIQGDAADDVVTLRLKKDTPGELQVDSSTPAAIGRQFFTSIVLNGGGGNDTLRIDDSNGTFTDTENTGISGGRGDDTLFGGAGNEVLSGDAGADTMAGAGGDDRFPWLPGEGNDQIDGGPGADDRLVFIGSTADENITLSKAGTGVHLFRDLGAVTQDAAAVEALTLITDAGADKVFAKPGVGSVASLTVFAGDGRDAIRGTEANDIITGGGGGDVVQGGEGDDNIFGEGDNDHLCGEAGDDRVEGREGADRVSGGAGSNVVITDALDTTEEFCSSVITAPPPEPSPTPAPSPTPVPNPAPAATLPGGFLGFAKPKVTASLKQLKVRVRNTHVEPIRIRLSGSEAGRRYRSVTRTIPAGRTTTISLATSRRLRKSLNRALARRSKAIRKPRLAVVNLETNGTARVRPRLTLRRPGR